MSDPIPYAKAGGPPVYWRGLRVFDEAGQEVKDVEEVNAIEGWLIRAKRNEAGDLCLEGDEIARERVEGHFIIVPPGI